MANIFNKKFEEISFDDIESMVSDKVPESQVLDYKRQFGSEDAAKLISAMANTHGGFILYGVEGDDKTNEPTRICGVTEKRLEDTVDNICLGSITPPVFCEKRYLHDVSGTSDVLLVRVPESDLTPHAIDHNTTVYVKTLAQKRPLVEKADLEKVQWLRNRREKYVTRRDQIILSASGHASRALGNMRANDITVEVAFVLLYPKQAVLSFFDLYSSLKEGLNSLPEGIPDRLRSFLTRWHFDNGIGNVVSFGEGPKYYWEFTVHGSYYLRADLDTVVDGVRRVRFDRIGYSVEKALDVAFGLAGQYGLGGSFLVKLGARHIRNTKIAYEWNVGTASEVSLWDLKEHYCGLDDSLDMDAVYSLGDQRKFCQETVLEFVARLFWIYGEKENPRGRAELMRHHWLK
ncbi:hypothetical protein C3F09_02990 [candidate division GN15 bacterium]|uniref:Schlafen AlbA-2 domain-containing protein n=1 Tax=candidate division GN15 bacterium TaxID=2072418 RepID=A0A855X9F1_9BACT|nr:MAG: hypothetical protein C3F09_02990 [candidate division GN15 bacterium]